MGKRQIQIESEIIPCFSSLSPCCDKMPTKRNLKMGLSGPVAPGDSPTCGKLSKPELEVVGHIVTSSHRAQSQEAREMNADTWLNFSLFNSVCNLRCPGFRGV